MNVNPLRIVIVGHVDHGKSTLVGRLLHDTGSLPEGKFEYVKDVCEKRGVPFEWAFVLDALQAERDQNITIDTCQIWFQSAQRPYVIIDAPGHKEFLKNMITGAAGADAAVLLIAANEGVREQSRRHAYLLQMLGIRELVVLVNKMDLVDEPGEVFANIEVEYRAFLDEIGLTPRVFVPISARHGSNVASNDDDGFAWYDGPTVLEALDAFKTPPNLDDQPLRFPVQDVFRFDERRIIAGRVEAGTLRVGDELVFAPSHKRAVVQSIEGWKQTTLSEARAGQSVGVTLDEQIFVERGHIAHHPTASPVLTSRLEASIFWMGPGELEVDKPYRLKLTTQEVECKVVEIRQVINAGSLESQGPGRDRLQRDDVAELVIETSTPIAVDLVGESASTSRFVLVDGYDVAGGGIITTARSCSTIEASIALGRITSRERHQRNGHRGGVLWVHTDPGGPELSALLERALFQRGIQAVWLDETQESLVRQTCAILASGGLVALVHRTGPAPEQRDDVPGAAASIVVDLRQGTLDPVFSAVGELAEPELVEAVVDHVLPLLRTRAIA